MVVCTPLRSLETWKLAFLLAVVQTRGVLLLAPPVWKAVPGNTDIVEGQKLALSCKAHGSPVPKVAWMFRKGESEDWTAVRNQVEAVVGPDGTLSLESAQVSHSGEFKCSADNGIGRLISHTFAVKVRGKKRKMTR
ncbi:hypothetical protein HPB50_012351 [Hyalomma asiaticum]|uniref:Uncharacterized protein n=1 Tax=Hyalomma asiaticum TaxID=266040 RepID=A0ACB7S4P0_HYAAI|nr:hypothetical protein HPB50_012351 [Hyalomma asiaticum]